MWWKRSDIQLTKSELISVNNLTGYVLPHAGTTYTGSILSHSLRFKPTNFFDKILIIYYPSQLTKNVKTKKKRYYHEYYVVKKSVSYVCRNYWNYGKKTYVHWNVRDKQQLSVSLDLSKTLVIVSADFSHHLDLQQAISLENCAAKSLVNRYLSSLPCQDVLDHKLSFQRLFHLLPKTNQLQWIGRTRSPGKKGVGYLSFLIRDISAEPLSIPDGFFVTSYDNQMNTRECLGDWLSSNHEYNNKKVAKKVKELVKEVYNCSITSSRLTGGQHISIPVTHYTITYLFKEPMNTPVIRGWHGVKYDAFYLPSVLLENVYDNGTWIRSSDTKWPQDTQFRIESTLQKLQQKARQSKDMIINLDKLHCYSTKQTCHKFSSKLTNSYDNNL